MAFDAAPFQFLGAALAIGFGAIGSAVGEGYTAAEAAKGISRQPRMQGELLRTMLVAQAVAESSGIFALVVAVVMTFKEFDNNTIEQAAALLGSGLAMGVSAIGSGIGCGLAGSSGCKGAARQPGAANKITVTMLLGQALSTSPSIFGFVIALILIFSSFSGSGLIVAAGLLGAGISMGAGGIGPGYGIGIAGQHACDAVAGRTKYSAAINRTLLMGGAVSESTSIYAFIVSVSLIYFAGG